MTQNTEHSHILAGDSGLEDLTLKVCLRDDKTLSEVGMAM